jgi:ribosomal protein RSM22 (predicted rRNA methylase)
VDHSAHHHGHGADEDWAAQAAKLEIEAQVLLPYVTEVASWAAELCRRDGVQVRRILDVGSGPGVIACELARCFPSA